jgi:uncharacterized membrane protein
MSDSDKIALSIMAAIIFIGILMIIFDTITPTESKNQNNEQRK